MNDNKTFAEACDVADTFWSRFKGLMGAPGLAHGSGLLIEPCNSVHSFFMRFEIDVVYLSRADGSESNVYSVLSVRRAMAPWRVDFPVFGARAVLELPSGGAAGLREGDLLCLS